MASLIINMNNNRNKRISSSHNNNFFWTLGIGLASLIYHLPMRTSHWSKKKLKCFKTWQVFAAHPRILELSWLFIESRQKFSVLETKEEFRFANLSALLLESTQVPQYESQPRICFLSNLVENFLTSYRTSFLLHVVCGPLVSHEYLP